MKRTQVQLDEKTYDTLRLRAFEQGVSMAALVRELLHRQLGIGMAPRRLEDYRFIGSGRSTGTGVEPVSERHDEALAQDYAR